MKNTTWNEWSPLRKVIVGTATNARVPQKDRSLKAINYAASNDWHNIPSGPYPQKVIDESTEDLEILVENLKKLGVTVLRPDTIDTSQIHGNGIWNSDGYYTYCPRDSVLTYGNHIIETPMPLRARQNETRCFSSIFNKQINENEANWVSAPRPKLEDHSYNIEEIHPDRLTLNEVEPCFDAANVLKCGTDLFYLVSNSGNKLGGRWLSQFLGQEYKVHFLEGIYSYMHLDSTISFLRPGLLLANPSRLNATNLPNLLKNWQVIWCPESTDIGYYGNYCHSSPWIGMNLLMVNERLAIVEEHQIELIKELKKYGIESLPLPLRHSRTLGGGFHCVTLDLDRDGPKESYF